MSKLTITVLGATLALAANTALAADARNDARANQGSSQQVESIKPDQMRASKVIGGTVYDVQNQKVGDVKDIILDKDGKVDALVVDVGKFLGIGGKHVALKPTDVKTDNNRLTVSKTKDDLKQMAEYKLADRDTGAGTSASPVRGGKLGSSDSTSTPPKR
jgi:sporulation protein YlmC with PRC-barrel domain